MINAQRRGPPRPCASPRWMQAALAAVLLTCGDASAQSRPELTNSVRFAPVYGDPATVEADYSVWGSTLFLGDEAAPHTVPHLAGPSRIFVARDCVHVVTRDDVVFRYSRQRQNFEIVERVPGRHLDSSAEVLGSVEPGVGTYIDAQYALRVAHCSAVRTAAGEFIDAAIDESGQGLAVNTRGALFATRDFGKTLRKVPVPQGRAEAVVRDRAGRWFVDTSAGPFTYENGALAPCARDAMPSLLWPERSPADEALRARRIAQLARVLDEQRPEWRIERAVAEHRLVMRDSEALWIDDLAGVTHLGDQIHAHPPVPAEATCTLRAWGPKQVAQCETAAGSSLLVWSGRSFVPGPFPAEATGRWARPADWLYSDDGRHVLWPTPCPPGRSGSQTYLNDGRGTCAFDAETGKTWPIPYGRWLTMTGNVVLVDPLLDGPLSLVHPGKTIAVDPPSGWDIVSGMLAPGAEVLAVLRQEGDDAATRLASWRDGDWTFHDHVDPDTSLRSAGPGRALVVSRSHVAHATLSHGALSLHDIPSPDGGPSWQLRSSPSDFCEGDVCTLDDRVLIVGTPPFRTVQAPTIRALRTPPRSRRSSLPLARP